MTHPISRRRLIAFAGAALCTAGPPAALAQRAPLGMPHLVVGAPAGGGGDMIARLIARSMTGVQAAIVENRPGASGRLALDVVARAKPDGETLIVTPDFALTIYPHIYRKLSYDPLRDFIPIAIFGRSEYALCVGPALPNEVRTVGDLLQWFRQNPKSAFYASPSPGSTAHFAGFLLSNASKVPLTHVAYKGGSPALQDLLGGQVAASINPVSEILPHINGGKLRVLATTGSNRSRFLPDIPTLREQGYRDAVAESWIGAFAPGGTPEHVMAALESSFSDALKSPAVIDGLISLGLNPLPMTRSQSTATLRDDLQRWATVVKASGFTMEE